MSKCAEAWRLRRVYPMKRSGNANPLGEDACEVRFILEIFIDSLFR
jgi:hypothetical protein